MHRRDSLATALIAPALLAAVLFPSAVWAKVTIGPEEAPIAAVTVFPQGARIERRLSLVVEPGSETLEIVGLTSRLDPQSLRIATPEGPLRIASVESRLAYNETASREEVRSLEGAIEELEDEKAMLQDRLRVAERQLDLVGALIAAAGKPDEEAPSRLQSADHWRQMLTLIGEGSEGAYARQREARKLLRAVARKLERLHRQLATLRAPGRETYSVLLALEAREGGAAEISLSYQIDAAQWRPLYDARLDSEESSLELTQLAEVTQTSGEDWSRVDLTLSTTLPSRDAALPRLGSWFLDLYDPRGQARRENKQAAAPSPESLAEQEAADRKGFEAGDESRSWATAIASEFAAEWRVPGRVNLPADGAAHKLRLEERSFEVALGARILPKISTAAYLVGEISYDGDTPLLPGTLSIYRDGAYVGRQSFALLRPSETREIAFGLDERIAVEYRLVTGEVGSVGIISNDRQESRLYAIRVQNHHRRPIALSVLDQVPVPRHEDIEVALLDETTEPSERDVEDRRGLLAWRWNAEPGEVRTIRFGYAVRFPEDQAVLGL